MFCSGLSFDVAMSRNMVVFSAVMVGITVGAGGYHVGQSAVAPMTSRTISSNIAAAHTVTQAGTMAAIGSADVGINSMVSSGQLRVVACGRDILPAPWTAGGTWATGAIIQQNPSLMQAFVKAVLQDAGTTLNVASAVTAQFLGA